MDMKKENSKVDALCSYKILLFCTIKEALYK